MAAVEKVERKFAPLTGTESDITWAMIDFYRNTLLTKCQRLSDDQLVRAAVEPSPLTLLGLLRHMTEVERYWFEECIMGRTREPLYGGGTDSDFRQLRSIPADAAVRRFYAACDTSRSIASDRSLDEEVWCEMFGKPVSVRFIAIHLIEEYARHCGHADLLREAIDGRTGL